MSMINNNLWKGSSGKIANPGNDLFLKLAAYCVRKVKQKRDEEGQSYARKAMIITEMYLNTNGLWELSQFTPDLHAIIPKHSAVFDAARNEDLSSVPDVSQNE